MVKIVDGKIDQYGSYSLEADVVKGLVASVEVSITPDQLLLALEHIIKNETVDGFIEKIRLMLPKAP